MGFLLHRIILISMMFKARLSFLDKIVPLSYSNPTMVWLNNNPNIVIGTCEIYTDENMNHFGNFEFNGEISLEKYLYYFEMNTNNGVYNLNNLSLHDEPRKDRFTKKLKDLIL